MKCDKCGNDKDFYMEVSVIGKIKISAKTHLPKGKVYDIDKDNTDDFYEDTFYCSKCNNVVEDDD